MGQEWDRGGSSSIPTLPAGISRSPLPPLDLKALNEASSVSGLLRSCLIKWFNIALEELGGQCHMSLCPMSHTPPAPAGMRWWPGTPGQNVRRFTEHHCKPQSGRHNRVIRPSLGPLGISSLGDRDAPRGTEAQKGQAAVPSRLLPCGKHHHSAAAQGWE